MSNTSTPSPGNNKRKFIWAGIVIVLAVVVVFAITGIPPSESDTRGAIGAAEKYQVEQITDNDVSLKDPEFQAILQSDVFQELIQREDFQELLSHAGFGPVAGDQSFNTLLNSIGPVMTQALADPIFAAALKGVQPVAYDVLADEAMIGIMHNIGPDVSRTILLSEEFSTALNERGPVMRDIVTSQEYNDIYSRLGASAANVMFSRSFFELMRSKGPEAPAYLVEADMRAALQLKELRDLMMSKGPGTTITRDEMTEFLRLHNFNALLKREAAVGFLIDPNTVHMLRESPDAFTALVTDASFNTMLKHGPKDLVVFLDDMINIQNHAGPSTAAFITDPDFGTLMKRSFTALKLALKDPGFAKLLNYSVNNDLLKHGGKDYASFLKRNGSNLAELMQLKIWTALMKRQDAVSMMARTGFPKLMHNAKFNDLIKRQDWGGLTLEK